MRAPAKPLTRWVEAIRDLARRGVSSRALGNTTSLHALQSHEDISTAFTTWGTFEEVDSHASDIKQSEMDFVGRDCEERHWVSAVGRLVRLRMIYPKDFEIRKELEKAADKGARAMQSEGRWEDACVLWFARSTLRSEDERQLRAKDQQIDRNIAQCALKGARAAEATGAWANATQLWDFLRIVEPYSEVATKGIDRCIKKLVARQRRNDCDSSIVIPPPDSLEILPQAWKVDFLLSLGRSDEADKNLKLIEARQKPNSVLLSQRMRLSFYRGEQEVTIAAATAAIACSVSEGENTVLISSALHMAAESLCRLNKSKEARALLFEHFENREDLHDRDFAALYATAGTRSDLDEVRHFLWKSFNPDSKAYLRALKHYSFALRDLGLTDEAVAIARKRLLSRIGENSFSISTETPADDGWSATAELALLDLKADMQSGGFDFFLISGTLLGCIREGSILKHDKDIDVGVLHGIDLTIMKAHLQSTGRFRVKHLPLSTIARVTHCNGTSIDLFVHWQEGEEFFHQGQKTKWRNTPFSLKPREFLGTSFLVPSNPELYLQENYGDWREPVKDWDTFIDTPNMVIADEKHLIWYFYNQLFDSYVSGKVERFRKLWDALSGLIAIDNELRQKVSVTLAATESPAL